MTPPDIAKAVGPIRLGLAMPDEGHDHSECRIVLVDRESVNDLWPGDMVAEGVFVSMITWGEGTTDVIAYQLRQDLRPGQNEDPDAPGWGPIVVLPLTFPMKVARHAPKTATHEAPPHSALSRLPDDWEPEWVKNPSGVQRGHTDPNNNQGEGQ